jgi:hypothetical protein
MKGAFLIGRNVNLFELVKETLLSLGGKVSSDGMVAQLQDEVGGRFTAYPVTSELEWEFKAGGLAPATEEGLPDVSDMTGVAIECKSEFQFAVLVREIAKGDAGEIWVVDGDGLVWPALKVDTTRLRLLCRHERVLACAMADPARQPAIDYSCAAAGQLARKPRVPRQPPRPMTRTDAFPRRRCQTVPPPTTRPTWPAGRAPGVQPFGGPTGRDSGRAPLLLAPSAKFIPHAQPSGEPS